MASVTVKNYDRLLSKMKNIANFNTLKAMNDATKVVHAQAKTLAPVDTGNLKGSIHMEVKNKKEKIEGRVYTNLQYAPYVEFGTGIKGNGSYPYSIEGLELAYKEDWAGMPAQPYMYPALKNNEKYIKKLFKSDIKDNLNKICKGGR
jgi:HK97 gp10 family phage protein